MSILYSVNTFIFAILSLTKRYTLFSNYLFSKDDSWHSTLANTYTHTISIETEFLDWNEDSLSAGIEE